MSVSPSSPQPPNGLPAAEDADLPDEDLADDSSGPDLAPFDHPHLPLPVNSPSDEASNRDARRREAEEDRELIYRAQKGDQGAFRQLVERHQRRAYAIALGLVRDPNDAREIVQEAFLRVFRGLPTFQGSSSFFTWLYRIVTNLAIDLIRKPGRKDAELVDRQQIDETAEIPHISRIDGADPINVMRRREIASRIQAALDDLPEIHRGVILMREVEGMSYEQMAEVMNVSKGTIMSRLFHARQKLQRALADCYAEEGSAGAREVRRALARGAAPNTTEETDDSSALPRKKSTTKTSEDQP
ncbi:MAG: sigma-70 family RNA polymerase sigma factor [Polyangiaceae bacterium]